MPLFCLFRAMGTLELLISLFTRNPPIAWQRDIKTNASIEAAMRSRHGAPDRKSQKMPLRTRQSFTRATPRGLQGR
jgi:hypothetical protein